MRVCSVGRFDVSKLHEKSVNENETNTTKDCFQKQVCKSKELWTNEGTVEENWAAIRTALSEVAQTLHGMECRRPQRISYNLVGSMRMQLT